MKFTARTALPLLTLTLGCCDAHAQTQVYFAEYQFQAARMMAMNPDGSIPHALFNLPADQWLPLGITFDAAAGRMFWIDSAGASEARSANLDGSSPLNIAPLPGFCRGTARDAAGRIFFSSNNNLMRLNADGSGLVTIFTGILSEPIFDPEVDATNAHVYVGADNEIKRMDLDGSNVKTVVRGVDHAIALGLDIAAGSIYWVDADTISDYVARARLDGSDFRVLIDNSPSDVSGSSGLIEILVDPAAGKLYFADELLTTIRSANLDGSNVQLLYTSPAGKAPSGLTLSTGEPAQPLQDCNHNGVNDDIDIAAGAPDCDNNGIIDTCQVNPCPNRVLLVDNGSNAVSLNGRALGTLSEWQIFQPFDVPTSGWTIGEVAVDGFNTNYADGSGLTMRLYPDDGTGTRPNETTSLAHATVNLRFATSFENWVYAPLAATLAPGRFWIRLEANNPTVYGGSINLGFTGLQSRLRGSSGNFTSPQSPIALRIIQGNPCTADFNHDSAVNSQDFFDFLTAFFAQQPSADFNHDGTINSQDFFDFLAAFFAGC